MTDDFKRIESIFHEALAVSLDARAELIDSRCEGDADLAAQVRALLHASEREERRTASLLAEREKDKDFQLPGSRIGPYLLDRLLGRGGMGAVYLAHRADGEFEQEVAIKLIDLPLASHTFRERFRQERQILAGLQHSYIARLLDGGVSSSGEPYLVMEFVDGVPIHRFCERENLPPEKLLRLFLQVCEAVQFAHQNFVVHRDLKPDNILVAPDGTPRLLDFGTAKLLAPSYAAAGSGLTREGYQSFTPQYASPEQVLGNPVTAASDTYSLGVLLYLLLTGTPPYELAELASGEMLRVICEEPPRRPATNAGKRLDADLEAILLKALRKEPGARYATAEQLAADVRAWLEKRPVLARKGTLRYRAAKFVRRNRLLLAATSLLACSVLAGIGGILWQSHLTRIAERRAEARAADLNQLSASLMSELDEAIRELPGSTGAQKLLVSRVLEHLDRMAADTQGDRQTELSLVDAYTRLGNLMGNGYDQNLGDPEGGLKSLDAALRIARPLAASYPADHDVVHAFALALQSRSEILWTTGKTDQAIPLQQEAVSLFERLATVPRPTAEEVMNAATAYGTLGDELTQSGTASLSNSDGVVEAYRKSLALDQRALAFNPKLARAARGVRISHLKIGTAELDTDPASALKEFESALTDELSDPNPQTGLSNLRIHGSLQRKKGIASSDIGLFSQAHSAFEQAEKTFRSIQAHDANDTRASADLAILLQDEADAYGLKADPVAGGDAVRRQAALIQEEKRLRESIDLLGKNKDTPNIKSWSSMRALFQVRIGAIHFQLRGKNEAPQETVKALAALKALGQEPTASGIILLMVSEAFRRAEPSNLRDAKFSIECARRAAEMAGWKSPARQLELANADRAAGEAKQSRAAAQQGLSLLPALRPGEQQSILRRQLESLARQ